jgi:hypothetical protein
MTCKLLLWDTAGQECFQRLAITYYKQAAAAIVCFDVTRTDSLERLQTWLLQVQQNMAQQGIVLCVAACKTDLPAAPGIKEQAMRIAEEYGALYVETSAKMDRGVTSAFSQVAEQVLHRHQEALSGRGKLLAVSTGAHLHSSPRTSRLRSLSPTNNNMRDDRRSNNLGQATSNSAAGGIMGNNFLADEKKDDDVLEDNAKMASPRPGLMCDNGFLVCGSDMNAAALEKCCIS